MRPTCSPHPQHELHPCAARRRARHRTPWRRASRTGAPVAPDSLTTARACDHRQPAPRTAPRRSTTCASASTVEDSRSGQARPDRQPRPRPRAGDVRPVLPHRPGHEPDPGSRRAASDPGAGRRARACTSRPGSARSTRTPTRRRPSCGRSATATSCSASAG